MEAAEPEMDSFTVKASTGKHQNLDFWFFRQSNADLLLCFK